MVHLRVINVLAKFEKNDPWKILDAGVLTGLVGPAARPIARSPVHPLGRRQYPGAVKGCGGKMNYLTKERYWDEEMNSKQPKISRLPTQSQTYNVINMALTSKRPHVSTATMSWWHDPFSSSLELSSVVPVNQSKTNAECTVAVNGLAFH